MITYSHRMMDLKKYLRLNREYILSLIHSVFNAVLFNCTTAILLRKCYIIMVILLLPLLPPLLLLLLLLLIIIIIIIIIEC